ncbi:MAG: hypothetical protein FWE97_03365 [Dehalococcoidia bacterium]|nr:hypothetical protein [Dehalococcoidia bacterium]
MDKTFYYRPQFRLMVACDSSGCNAWCDAEDNFAMECEKVLRNMGWKLEGEVLCPACARKRAEDI